MGSLAKRSLSLLVVFLLIVSVGIGCGASGPAKESSSASDTNASESTSGPEQQPVLEYSVYTDSNDPLVPQRIDNPNDVVTPEIEKRTGVRVKEVITAAINNTIPFKDRLNTFIAANNMPDVMIADIPAITIAVGTGKFADLTDYIKDMANYNKYFIPEKWKYFTTADGKKYCIPQIVVNPNNKPELQTDPYAPMPWCWTMWAREDILKQCGYSFIPLEELAKTTYDVGKLPTLDQLKIEPAIDTSDKFVELLRKIKALNLKVGDKPVIPFSGPYYTQFILSTMMDCGRWQVDSTGQISAFLGKPDAKRWLKLFHDMYQEGLIDKDMISQKDDQLIEKIVTGRVAVGMGIGDMVSANPQAMAKVNPDYKIRFIPYPKDKPGFGVENVDQGAYFSIIINKDFKDIKRLTQYFDWLYSDEALDLLAWGPESAGLWEMKDGKKTFKDPEFAKLVLDNTTGQKGADYYGINSMSKIVYTSPVMNNYNPFSPNRSYPLKLNMYEYSKDQLGAVSQDFEGKAAITDGGENCNTVDTWYWSNFANGKIANLLIAKTDGDFDKAWNDIYAEFLKYGKYNEAKADMEKWFATHK